jgi:uncharacterized protein with HEPN domain
MSPRDQRAYLWDITGACRHIITFAQGKTLEDYQRDILLRSAIERQLMIVGEALNQAIRLVPELGDRIGDSRQIVSFRNRLVHGYATIAHDIVWDVVANDVARLLAEVERLLAEG